MKRIAITLALILAVAFLYLIWWRQRRTTSSPGSGISTVAPTSTQKAIQPQAALDKLKSAVRREEAKQARRAANSQPIEFYGVIQDQESNTIPNVHIEYTIYPTPVWPDSGRGEVVSDSQGKFSITDHRGASISFNLIKPGYRAADPHLGATFSLMAPPSERYVPDSTKPQILRMWKDKGQEQLIAFQESFSCPLPDGSINIDLTSGEMVANGGDVKFQFNRGQENSTSHSFDWRCSIEPINGGIQFINSLAQFDTTFQAPSEGYTRQIEVKMAKEDPKWQAGFSRLVFLNSRDGQVFAKFNLVISIKPEKANVSLYRGVANANASRNWEISSNNVKHVFK